MNYYQPQNAGFYNPYYGQQPQQNVNYTQANYQQPVQQPIQAYKPQTGLQGKSVDSIDVVKATDIPLDFSVSYFPLTDGTAIVTKQLMQDGTSKMTIYKPIEDNENTTSIKFVTMEDLQKEMKKVDNAEIKDELKGIKKQIKDITKEIDDLKEE